MKRVRYLVAAAALATVVVGLGARRPGVKEARAKQVGSSSRGFWTDKKTSVHPQLPDGLLEAARGRRTGRAGRRVGPAIRISPTIQPDEDPQRSGIRDVHARAEGNMGELPARTVSVRLRQRSPERSI
jgi:hypothetical protein